MTNKALRILIADERHEHLIYIEKLLNRFGYYRIAPVRTFDEVTLLTSSSSHSFDVLIANKALATARGINIFEFCQERMYRLHVLFYDSPEEARDVNLNALGKFISVSLASLPDFHALSELMNRIDPRPQCPGLVWPHIVV